MDGQLTANPPTGGRPQGGAKAALDRRSVVGAGVLAGIAVGGLFYVKWDPYFHRALTAAAQHSIGASIISGRASGAPAPSVAAALGYAWAYGKAIWQAMILGLVLGAGVQAVVPRDWLAKLLGRSSFSGVAAAGLASVPSMM